MEEHTQDTEYVISRGSAAHMPYKALLDVRDIIDSALDIKDQEMVDSRKQLDADIEALREARGVKRAQRSTGAKRGAGRGGKRGGRRKAAAEQQEVLNGAAEVAS